MTRTEHLLVILMEEAAEVAQRASKALRFGPGEVQPGQTLTNAQRLRLEIADFDAVVMMLADAGLVAMTGDELDAHAEAKKAKVERYLAYSAGCGTLSEGPR